ncbi:MAG TPA: type IX secretion system protein PorQ [Edaphocola sp.]|nr:type IX secretion system protein PorQ [Edaphocola sp.]
MNLKSLILTFFLISFQQYAQSQIVGGTHAFEMLNVSNSAHVSALGGLTPAIPDQDVSLAWQNPALYRPGVHNQLSFNYNLFFADIKIMNLQYAYYVPKLKTTFGGGIQSINYGTFQAADIYGISLGEVQANDIAVSFSASRSYGERWRYGATLKYAHSVLADRTAGALLTDVGVVYHDTSNSITLGIVARNMGFMTKKYNPNNLAEPLPFDVNIGFTKELKNVPLKLFVVAHHLYQWDIRYNNPADKKNNIFFNDSVEVKDKNKFVDNMFRHLNFGTELILGKRLGVTLAYNHLRRGELSTLESKGMAGFSLGTSLYLNRLQVHYARSIMATAGAYNEFGLNLSLDKMFKVGKKTNTWHWNNNYPNW